MTRDYQNREGLMLILSSPSGAGKTTITRAITSLDNDISMSTSVTTRAKRPNEREGVDYYFIDHSKYEEMVDNDDLLEHAKVFTDYYGTPRKHVESLLDSGKDVLFDIDWQGAKQLKAKARERIVSIFILPPSLKELENRLRNRGQDVDKVIQIRMANAVAEISHYKEYDYVLVNNDLDDTIYKVKTILDSERLKKVRNKWVHGFVENLKL